MMSCLQCNWQRGYHAERWYAEKQCQWLLCLVRRGGGIALDIARGLHYLHSHNIVHLDLKSPNILLTEDCAAKIADVGLARIFSTRSLDVVQARQHCSSAL